MHPQSTDQHPPHGRNTAPFADTHIMVYRFPNVQARSAATQPSIPYFGLKYVNLANVLVSGIALVIYDSKFAT